MSPVSYVEVMERCVCSGGGCGPGGPVEPPQTDDSAGRAEALTHVDGAWE